MYANFSSAPRNLKVYPDGLKCQYRTLMSLRISWNIRFVTQQTPDMLSEMFPDLLKHSVQNIYTLILNGNSARTSCISLTNKNIYITMLADQNLANLVKCPAIVKLKRKLDVGLLEISLTKKEHIYGPVNRPKPCRSR